MKCIGIDKRDPEYRHFYYDDETALQSNPPKYKVTYTDNEKDIDYIDCNQVVRIKTIKEEVVKSPQEQVLVAESLQEQVLTAIENPNGVLAEDDSAGNSVTIEKPKRKRAESKKETTKEPQKRGRKKKISEDMIIDPSAPKKLIELNSCRVFHLFEYDVIKFEFSDINELKDALNKYGDDGWELVQSDITDTLFSIKKNIICIMKRVKD